MSLDSMLTESSESELTKISDEKKQYKMELVWRNIVLMIILHASALYGFYLWLTTAKWQTNLTMVGLAILSGMGITAGAHRLWAHRSYKANIQLRILLCIMNTMAFQNDIYEWSRDHRVHHKFSETDADPHNSKRGYFFAHVGWLLCKKHPQVLIKGKTVDLSDLLLDPVVRFQRRFYIPLMVTLCFIIPSLIPYYFWNEDIVTSFFVCSMLRYCYTLHSTWLVNSSAHLYGSHPYDKSIGPSENQTVVLSSFGEGYHNYHHVFPRDYSTSEYGWQYNFNFTTFFIESFAKIGWTYDLKKVSKKVIKDRQQRTGELFDINKELENGQPLSYWLKVFPVLLCPFVLPLIYRNIIITCVYYFAVLLNNLSTKIYA